MHATIHIDGGSRGNPGPASYAVVLERPGLPVHEECDTLGQTTNNIAEYSALVRALEIAQQLSLKSLTIYSDSELLVKQMRGEYKVKNDDLKELFDEAKILCRHFEQVNIIHVRRDKNKRADQLCNLALDGSPKPRSGQASSPPAPLEPPTPVTGEEVLAKWANFWASNGVSDATLAQAWQEITQAMTK